ncbi:MAG: selenium-dependent molybdenum cofactor biosynthesis protein YqeB, partial [Bacillota bacterium]
VIRGLLKPGLEVEVGMKLADIDPRSEKEYCYNISDKALAVAGGVLEAILFWLVKTDSEVDF